MAEVPAGPQALFKIGSITKLYTATAIAKLAHEGTLSLDDTLAESFPELVKRIEHVDQITVRTLVQHRSGIPNYSDDEDWDWLAPPIDDDASLALILDDPADFAPDARYRYSKRRGWGWSTRRGSLDTQCATPDRARAARARHRRRRAASTAACSRPASPACAATTAAPGLRGRPAGLPPLRRRDAHHPFIQPLRVIDRILHHLRET